MSIGNINPNPRRLEESFRNWQRLSLWMNTVATGSSMTSGTGSGIQTLTLTASPVFTVTGSPATGNSGTITLALANETANRFLSGPLAGGAATPTFRAISPLDLGTGSTPGFVLTVNGTAMGFAPASATAAGMQTLTLTAPTIFTVSGSPATGNSASLTIALANETANRFLAGPISGGATVPTFRSISPLDLGTASTPGFILTVNGTSMAFSAASGIQTLTLTGSNVFTIAGSPVTGASGALTIALSNETANRFLAGPVSGAATDPAFRAISPLDLGTGSTAGFVLTVNGTVMGFAAVTAASPLTTKGDIFTYTTTNARLAVVAPPSLLVSYTSSSTGLLWCHYTPASTTILNASGVGTLNTYSATGVYLTFNCAPPNPTGPPTGTLYVSQTQSGYPNQIKSTAGVLDAGLYVDYGSGPSS